MTLAFFLQFTAPNANVMLGYIPVLLVFAIFYFLLFMPMQKQKKQLADMVAGLKNGDTVVTNGGIIGSIQTINDDDTLIIRVKPDNLKLQIVRSSVSSLFSDRAAK